VQFGSDDFEDDRLSSSDVLLAAEACLKQHYGSQIVSQISGGRLGDADYQVGGWVYELKAGQTDGQTPVEFDFAGIACTVATGMLWHLPPLVNGKQPTGEQLYKFWTSGLVVAVVPPATPVYHWACDGWGDVHVAMGNPSAYDMALMCLELAWEGNAWDEDDYPPSTLRRTEKLLPMYLQYQPPELACQAGR
jgi:hypothetical protein